jgi:hypothetical protein
MTPPAPRSAFVDSQTGRISKYCPHCGELWPVELAFYALDRKSGKPAAWQSWCRACGYGMALARPERGAQTQTRPPLTQKLRSLRREVEK